MKTPVEMAIAKAGGAIALAKALRIKHQAVYAWKKIPVARVLQIEKLTGIPRHVLRSDIYPKGQ